MILGAHRWNYSHLFVLQRDSCALGASLFEGPA